MKKRMSVYDFCDAFLVDRSLVSIEYLEQEDVLFQGSVKELKNTLDGDLRSVCGNIFVKYAMPSLSLQKGLPLSTTLMI